MDPGFYEKWPNSHTHTCANLQRVIFVERLPWIVPLGQLRAPAVVELARVAVNPRMHNVTRQYNKASS